GESPRTEASKSGNANVIEMVRTGKPMIIAANKAEKGFENATLDFTEMGCPTVAISAAKGRGVQELMRAILRQLKEHLKLNPPEEISPEQENEAAENEEQGFPDPPIRVAMIGCPNAGKSSLINQILKEDRLITSEVSGTTRDSVDIPLTAANGQRYTLIDTAGLRRKSRVSQRVEKYSVMAALKSIDRTDITVLVLDATRDISDQDKRIARYAEEAGRGLVFVVNKWDTVQGGRREESRMRTVIADTFVRLAHVPILFVSAKNGRHTGRILHTARRVWRSAQLTMGTGAINRWLADCLQEHPPPRTAGKPVKLRYATQVGTAPPSLLIFGNRPDAVPTSYIRFLENRLREQFALAGTPIRIALRGGENPFKPTHSRKRKKPHRR
ncbi:MAG: ribosome biogenesis GTPase Der, partial [Magnetococcales bacterium]|nr:ribosome biogenesis GTPase Der [Magnetococcales bacterium]